MQEIIRQMLDAIMPIAVAALSVLVARAAGNAKSKYAEVCDTKIKKELVDVVVKYVEQTAKEKGDGKLNTAIEMAGKWFAAKNIPVSESELNMLIEAAVNGLTKQEKS